MTLLLDTPVVLWGLTADPALDKDFLDRLAHDPDIYLSPVTVWEIAIKQDLGKLPGPGDLPERVRDIGFRHLPITADHAILAGRLPQHHRDPFDRMLIAQAKATGMVLATRDSHIQKYDVPILVV